MQGWIFLSKQGNDKYINMLARSAGAEPYNSDYFDYEYDVAKDGNKLVLRGILKHKIMQQCWRDQRDFFYMDSGYLGNHKSELNPMGNKNWHRIVRNNIQHGDVIARPADRWEALGMAMKPRRQGRRRLGQRRHPRPGDRRPAGALRVHAPGQPAAVPDRHLHPAQGEPPGDRRALQRPAGRGDHAPGSDADRKSTRLNSSHRT